MKNKLLYPLLFSISFSALAENYAVFMGGGGEPKGNKTMFDREIPNMKKGLDAKNWQSEIAFNGGHKNTEAAMTKSFGSAPPFTSEAYKRIIADYKEKIQNGTLKSGDQLLLYVNTHGAQRMTWSKEKSHSIATAGGTIQDFNTGAGSTLVSMDDLESLLKLANDKGVKVGLLDFSCHSGAALAIQQPNTCVISASGPNHYAYGGSGGVFSAQFLSNMKKGRSLEDVFLLARQNTRDTSFPMISSPVGKDLNQEIYQTLTPYLYDYDPKHNKFTPYLMSEIEQGEACEAPQRLESILKLIDEVRDIKNIAKDASYKSKEADKLKAALKDYFALMEKLKTDYNALSIPAMKTKEKFCSPYKLEYNNKFLQDKEEPGCIEYTIEEIVSANFEWSENYYKELLAKKSDDFSKKFYTSQLQNLAKVKSRREELMTQYPDMKKRETFFKDQPKLESKTGALAWRVAQAQQDFYQALYKQRSINETRPNPCKDFVL